MGILDNLRNKVEKLGDRAKEGFDDAKDKAGDLLDDAKERLGRDDDETSPLTESSDVGPDSSSTDAVQPGYVTAEDDVTEESDESSLEAETGLDAEDEPDATSDVISPEAAGLDPVELDAQETAASEPIEPVADPVVEPLEAPVVEPVVAKDVDPYEQPLTESIGDLLGDRAALVDAVDPERDPQA